MKVLLLFPMADGQTGPAIKHAFDQLGHTVKVVDAKKCPSASSATAHNFKPDLVFCSRTEALTGQIVAIKEKFPGVVVCVWQVDTRHYINHWKHLFPLIRACDYYFVVASKLIPEWRCINSNTFWLPQGLQDEVYHKPKKITEADRQKYACDACFIGSDRGHRRSFLDSVRQSGVNFKVWGSSGNPQIYNEEHNKAVSLSKINLCISGWQANEKTTSVRNYKIMGAGGFVLELYRKGIFDIFGEGVVHCYDSPQSLVEKIRYWLCHEAERKVIADRGYEWVHANATYTHRIQMALDYMKDAL